MKQNIIISIINDEISSDIDLCMEFCNQYSVTHLELRSFNKINILNLPDKELVKIATKIQANGIKVISIASPLFKWDLKSKKISNFFGFRKQKSSLYYKKRIYEVAKIFNCPYIRIFSYLDNQIFQIDKFLQELSILNNMGQKYGINLLVENEPICNLKRIKDLKPILDSNFSNVSILIDIGNEFELCKRFELSNSHKKLLKSCIYFHIKDYDISSSKYIVLGDGNINYKKYINYIISKSEVSSIIFSLETHTSSKEDTISSFKFLKSLCQKNSE